MDAGGRRGGRAGVERRGQAPEATRMCGGSNHRRITAEERQSANGGEGGSKTCGRHVDGSGADNLTIAAVCAVGRGLDAPLLLVIVPVHFFLRRQLAFFLHTSLLRTQQTSIKTKAVVTAQMLALKLTSLPWIMAPASSRYCKCKLGAPVRLTPLSNCSKYSCHQKASFVRPLSVKLQQILNALCKSYDET